MHDDNLENTTQAVHRGIASEKTRESLAVMMAIVAVIISLIVGNMSSVGIGVVIMLGLFVLIWRYYSAPRSR